MTVSSRLTTPSHNPSDTSGAVPIWLLRIFRANLVAQIAIVVTGGLVRLTGSGLGCPTWPQCVDDSLIPTTRQEESWHKLVEFGNRTLTFVLGLLAIAAIVGVVVWFRQRRATGHTRRTPILVLAAIPLIGTIGQALLGGVTVLTGLNPYVVAAHFLVSIGIIGGCVILVDRAQDPADQPVTEVVRREITWLGNALIVVALVVVTLGTVVTGSGPNSGDADVSHRFGIDQRAAAWLHADAVYLFVGLLVAMLLALRLTDAGELARRRMWLLIAATAANGLVGYLQLFTGLPWAIVATHMLLACLVWVCAVRVRLSLRTRGIDQIPAH